MARKNLKQKLRSQVRGLRAIAMHQHELAGITINFEQRKLQPIAVAHGIMATLLSVKNHMKDAGVDIETDATFKLIEKEAQDRISQCVHTLLQMGLTMDQVNKHIGQGF